MDILELLLIAAGLSMDAFAVSVCKGLSVQRPQPRHYLLTGVWFGGFQALMPALGYLLGSAFERRIVFLDHWIAFVLLCLIGGNMIKESGREERAGASFRLRAMLPLAVATSIDALAVGVTFALLPGVSILPAASVIGTAAFLFSALGLKAGSVFGLRYKARAELAGGAILIFMGVKILLEHLGILPL